MSNDDLRFCVRCHTLLRDGVEVCSHCGAAQNARDYDMTVPNTPGMRLVRWLTIIIITITLLVIAFNTFLLLRDALVW